jgi:capsular polysaccharide biosynthesis protein
MTIDELLHRIVRGHWIVIMVCLVLPVAFTVLLQTRVEPRYVATVRLQVSASAPTSAFEADALGSRVIALATTSILVRRALSEAELDPGAAESTARHDVSSRRLGQSTVVELSISRGARDEARRLVASLAKVVSDFMNDANHARIEEALAAINRQLADAKDALSAATSRLRAEGGVPRPDLQADVDAAQATVGQLSVTKGSMLLADSTRDQVVVIDGDRPDVVAAPSSLLPRTALAVLLGLLLGIAAAVVIETLRPRLAGTRSLARRFEAPVLGQAGQRPAALVNAMSLAARRQGRDTVVLLGVDDRDDEVAHRLLTKISDPSLRDSQVVPASTQAHAPGSGANGTARTLHRLRFTDLTGVGPVDELGAGVVLVSSDAPRQRDVDTVEDILRTTRWPVLGVVGTQGAPRGGDQR